ncbi:GGDEF domain-containing protein [Chitinibacter sp. SCUT-21]|uniref:GGDEF domain-containing protein n=1 Tax=Chitinibacter sp. SCUT-21 TaxID=2970891 RepID=UPI0035A5CF55
MPPSSRIEHLYEQVLHIIQQATLFPLFQPIAAFKTGEVFGFEGLIRGPAGELHQPMALFQAAERCGLLTEMDIACRKVIISAFVQSQLPGKLFLNVCPSSFTQANFRPRATLDYLNRVGLRPQRIVIELTETQAISDYALLADAIRHYREMGFQIALDDLGEGFSGLRLWSELRPDIVKIDKYFIRGIHLDPQKRQFVRSLQQIAVNTHTQVIAEGIEESAELDMVRSLGIQFGQGYLLGHAAPHPKTNINLPPLETEYHSLHSNGSAMSLLRDVTPMSVHDSHDAVWRRFQAHAELQAIPILDQDKPVGLIRRHAFLELLARPFSRELFGTRKCSLHMNTQPLIVEQSTSLTELARLMTACEHRQLDEGFIITEQGRYLGMGTGRDFIRTMTELQLNAARHANPLTGLPGNVPIQETMSQLLAQQENFTVVYADLDHFKPYNDVYGYARGDELLKCVGQLLLNHFDPAVDFVGHVGGDDFILLLRSDNWQQRCEALLQDFSNQLRQYFSHDDINRGSYVAPNRQGEIQQHPLVSLSLGAARIIARWYESHHEVASIASSAKSMAKRKAGNALFIDRRINGYNESRI